MRIECKTDSETRAYFFNGQELLKKGGSLVLEDGSSLPFKVKEIVVTFYDMGNNYNINTYSLVAAIPYNKQHFHVDASLIDVVEVIQ